MESHYRFRLFDETLYVAIYSFDRFLAKKQYKAKEVGLVAIAALLMASKYEDIYPPELKEMMKLLDTSDKEWITKELILETEGTLLEVLSFDFTFVSPLRFLERFTKIANLDDRTFCIAQLLIEISLCDSNQILTRPSELAAAALYIALLSARGRVTWEGELEKWTRLTETEVKKVIKKMKSSLVTVKNSLGLKQIVKKKFSNSRMYEVGRIKGLSFPTDN